MKEIIKITTHFILMLKVCISNILKKIKESVILVIKYLKQYFY